MSKRTSTTKLDHDNWDMEEAPEDAGTFSPASSDVLKKRVILKAQRRNRAVKPAEDGTLPAVPNVFQNIKLTGFSSAQPSFSFLSSNNKSESKKTESAAAKVQTGFVFGNTASTLEVPSKAGEAKFSFVSSATTSASQGTRATSAPTSDTSSTTNFAVPKPPASGSSSSAITSASTSDTGITTNYAMQKPLSPGTSAPAITSAATCDTGGTSNFVMQKPLSLGTSAPAITSAATSDTGGTSNFAMLKPLSSGTSTPAITSALTSDIGNTTNFAMSKPLVSSSSAPEITSAQMSSSVFRITTASTSSVATPTTNGGSKLSAASPRPFGNIFSASSDKPSSADTAHKKSENKTDTGQFSFVAGNKKFEALPEHAKEHLPEENANQKSSDQLSSNSFIDKEKYYLMLKGLNKSVASWINESVDKNPHCILTPVFSDYITYLNDIKAKYKGRTGVASGENKTVASSSPASPPAQDRDRTDPPSALMVNGKDREQCSGFLLPMALPQNNVSQVKTSADQSHVPAPFSFPAFAPLKAFSAPQASSQLLSSSHLSSATVEKSAEPASANKHELASESKTEKTEETNDDDDDAEPPEPTPAPVVEEGAVYSKRCKVFVKKSGSYQDRGVGTAFIKPVVDNTKTQLIVRADTVLGNVLLNTLVSSSVPIQRLGPNNVAVVCVPTPDEKPPPTTVLLRVKTSADADQLYAKLNAYRK